MNRNQTLMLMMPLLALWYFSVVVSAARTILMMTQHRRTKTAPLSMPITVLPLQLLVSTAAGASSSVCEGREEEHQVVFAYPSLAGVDVSTTCTSRRM